MAPLTHLISTGWPEAVTFMLVFGRVAGLVVSAPFWGSRIVPVVVRVWIAILLAIATFPVVGTVTPAGEYTLLSVFLALGGEILFGLVLGWLAQILFAAMRLAGQEMELKSGLGLIQLADPHQGGQSGVFGALFELMAGLLFFAMNGHHLLVQALWSSYNVFPVAGEKFTTRLLEGLVSSSAEIFTIALRISAPVVIGLFLSDIILGLIGRAIPQMNVFMVAQPLQFGLAILLLFLAMPVFVWFFIRQVPPLIGVPGLAG
ncbi:MAG: flagellar biosynthetic protein FliR [Deltaproteobacteria bacterium]|nr:flagellar biosynthetic protein FliR [Deltaproteobacteria bacterium]